jgi:tRNA(Ile)-lysidine synthase
MGSAKGRVTGSNLTRTRLAVDWGLVHAGERVCVAVSGGADSTALLLSLCDANRPRNEGGLELGSVISAAHVHHGLRGAEADADEAFVRALCERLGVPLRVFRVDTPARQQAEAEGPEAAARALRYAALWGLLREATADVVATAHTLDDQAETVVMKLLRGAWTEGLGGISPELQGRATRGNGQGRLVRPMLGVRRAEVEAFLQERGQAWRNDASNQDLGLTRNRVRHQLMPLLREFNPNVEEALARTAELARDEEAFWTSELERVLPHVLLPGTPVRGGGRSVSTAAGEQACGVEIARLAAMPAALRRRVLRAAARGLGARLSAEETARLIALATPGVRAGSRLELHGGLRVERTPRELRLWRQDGTTGRTETGS